MTRAPLARVATLRTALEDERVREAKADETLRAMWADARVEFDSARMTVGRQVQRVREAQVAGYLDATDAGAVITDLRREYQDLNDQYAELEFELHRWMVRARIVRPEDHDTVNGILRMINDGQIARRPRR